MLACSGHVGDHVSMRRADRLFPYHQRLARASYRVASASACRNARRLATHRVSRRGRSATFGAVPIEGEAGVGYVLRKGSDIPPLMFTADEH